MNDIVKRRGKYSEPESRYFMTQILTGCQHMHLNSVIHRDLKLGNIMLDGGMNIKIGDFGLAALLNFPEERKKTVCGTPNYIAPEILYDQGDGHSFEVDIWSVGVILYTLLIGKPPFQTNNVQKIYEKIKRNEYEIPAESTISEPARELIQSILTPNPAERPTLIEIMNHPWFYAGSVPISVPSTACKMEPILPIISMEQSEHNFAKLKEIGGWIPDADDYLDDEDEEDYDEDEDEEMLQEDEVVHEREAAAAAAAEKAAKTKRDDMRKRLREMESLEDQRAQCNREAERAIQPGSPISSLLKCVFSSLLFLTMGCSADFAFGLQIRPTAARQGAAARWSPRCISRYIFSCSSTRRAVRQPSSIFHDSHGSKQAEHCSLRE